MVFKNFKSGSKKFEIRTFFWKHKGVKKFQALYLQAFGFIFWVFKDKKTYNEWPVNS